MPTDVTPAGDQPESATRPPTTTRRRFLRTAVNTGVAAGLVWGIGADYATGDDTVSVVYARARPSPDADALEDRRKQVPADWYESLKAAFGVQRRLREMNLSSLLGSFVVPGSFDDPAATLSVEATSESLEAELQEVVDAVPVDLSVIGELPPPPEDVEVPGAPFAVRDLDDPRVPGGVICESPEASGTLAPAVYGAEDGRRYFATANHVFGSQGTLVDEHADEPLSLRHGGDTRRIGRVDRGFPAADVVRVVPVDGYVPTSEIARATPSTVLGQFTRTGLADLMARDEELHKFGAQSGHTTGSILGVDGITCYTGDVCRTGQIRWGDADALTAGDSGSVNYHPDPERPEEAVLVGGFNNARSWWPGVDYNWGTAAHALLDEYGLHF